MIITDIMIITNIIIDGSPYPFTGELGCVFRRQVRALRI